MRKRIVLIMAIACILLITGCGASNSAEDSAGADNQIKITYVENAEQTDTEEDISTEGVADYPAAIMVNDTVYLMEGEPMPAEVDESAIIGYTESYTGTFPENNGETNFNPELGMPYAQVEGGIAVLYKNEWYLGTPFSNENMITFTGIIIDHTVESLVPVVCVKTLEEEVIPYEAVFFELPEGEEDWGLKIDAVVRITCSGGFTESAPHYGTLISIKDADTDVLLPLDGVTMEVAEYSDTNAEELADTFGILISLPVNSNWTVDSEYYLVDENNLRISYHDSIADADCTLLVSKNNNLNLPQAEYDETLNESWEGYTIGSQHIVVKVQHKKNDEKMVLATWKYNEYQFAIIGEDVNDSTPIPKVALYIINRLD